jgi:hypothetical protein
VGIVDSHCPLPVTQQYYVLLVTMPHPEVLEEWFSEEHDPCASAWENLELPASLHATERDVATPSPARRHYVPVRHAEYAP